MVKNEDGYAYKNKNINKKDENKIITVNYRRKKQCVKYTTTKKEYK